MRVWTQARRSSCCIIGNLRRRTRKLSILAARSQKKFSNFPEAAVFLRDSLDFTTKQQKKAKGATVRHVSGPELLEGVRRYALKEFGPMVVTVFDNWGIRSCEDIGHMVFNLIGAGIFGKTDEDSIEEDRKSVV